MFETLLVLLQGPPLPHPLVKAIAAHGMAMDDDKIYILLCQKCNNLRIKVFIICWL
jgi:hypothetical protein